MDRAFRRAEDRKSAGKLSFVVFRIGPELFALPTQVLHEVAESRGIHSLPHRRHSVVLGLVNIRGELLICVSVGRLLGLDRDLEGARPPAPLTRLTTDCWLRVGTANVWFSRWTKWAAFSTAMRTSSRRCQPQSPRLP